MNRLHFIIFWGAFSMLAGSGCGQAAEGVTQEMREGELVQLAGTDGTSVSNTQPRAIDFTLRDYRWKNRVLLLFTPSREEKMYEGFRRVWDARGDEVSDRDLLLVEVVEEGESRVGNNLLTESSAANLQKEFQEALGATVFILIGKDGTQKLRKASVQLDGLFELIDAMPMRRREMEQQRSRS
jgi:hypothetical protein